MSNEQHIPRRSALIPLSTNKVGRPDIIPFIEAVLDNEDFMTEAEVYKLNGGVTGRKAFDDAEFTRIVVEYDDRAGGSIRKMIVKITDDSDIRANGYTLAEVADKVNVAMRRRYALDKKGKVTGVNEKRFALLGHKPAATAAE